MLIMDELLISATFVNGEMPHSIAVYFPRVGIRVYGASGWWWGCLFDCKKQICVQVDTRVNLHYQRHCIERWMCITCTPKLIHHIEQKRTQRYYTYLVFTKIHPDIAQCAIQHWNYSIPDIKYHQ